MRPIADGVMAATHKLVDQALSGQWHEVPKTIEQRRLLLDQLKAGASPQDQAWLGALKEAIAESDAAVATISKAAGQEQHQDRQLSGAPGQGTGAADAAPSVSPDDLSAPASTLEWIARSRGIG
jgi:hypothetical protein